MTPRFCAAAALVVVIASCTFTRPLGYLGAGGPLQEGDASAFDADAFVSLDGPPPDDGPPPPDAPPACATCTTACTCGDCGKLLFGAPCAADADCATGKCDTGNTDKCLCADGMAPVDRKTADGTYCADATEVTNMAYHEFLDANVPVAPQACACTWNTTFQPAAPLGADDVPVVNVDWCDAVAFCRWKGKHLCGKVGGGGVLYESSDYTLATKSEWYNACSQGDSRPYPYGGAYDGTVCNGADKGNAALWGVGTQSCPGGFDGLFDMSGNAWEWENACEDRTGLPPDRALCRVRGGSFEEQSDGLRCDSAGQPRSYSRSDARPYVGFRCCAG